LNRLAAGRSPQMSAIRRDSETAAGHGRGVITPEANFDSPPLLATAETFTDG